jgi:hypothetical protein
MKAKVIIDNYGALSQELRRYFQEDSMSVTLDEEYAIYAISNWRDVFFFLIVNDINYPDWVPASIFILSDKSTPDDWICNILSGELKMILGPEFIAKDEEAYNSLVQLEPGSIRQFWERVGKNAE